ncbi:MAG TPA: transaldolase [Acidimicrobiales bacterium]|nr:transaldolase [Acidimicrobiales bacterium]
MTRLHDLFEHQGQSPWIDNLTRDGISGGHLESLVADGIRGVTSNPTIFQKAMSSGDAYDEQFSDLARSMPTEDAYWAMVSDDIRSALAVLRPVYDESGGTDGFVSLEVSPAMAADADASLESARRFHASIDRPNLMVKIPATPEGVAAIRAALSEGHNINVTLIFGLERYAEVVEAYLSALETLAASGRPLGTVASVASFFVSRVDTEVDRRLDAIGTPEALELRGKAALAQAKLAHEIFLEKFSGPRWDALAAEGARVQRPLWASTSTKNPDYPDLLYVDNLIGPNTINTLPDATAEAFCDHGTVARTVDKGTEEARRVLDSLAEVGVDLADVSATLEDEGVASFSKSFDELIQALEDKRSKLGV